MFIYWYNVSTFSLNVQDIGLNTFGLGGSFQAVLKFILMFSRQTKYSLSCSIGWRVHKYSKKNTIFIIICILYERLRKLSFHPTVHRTFAHKFALMLHNRYREYCSLSFFLINVNVRRNKISRWLGWSK